MPEKKIKQALINQLQLKRDRNDTGFWLWYSTLTIMIKEQFPSVNIIGIDVDEEIIAIAEKKMVADLSIPVKKYDGESLAFLGHQQFDRLVSSLVFHHIHTATKRTILSQLYRITKPGGELHIADFGKPKNLYTRAAFGLLRRFDGVENTSVNAEGSLPDFISDSGFLRVKTLHSFNTAFGTVDFLRAKRT